jgi:hypothetical protein
MAVLEPVSAFLASPAPSVSLPDSTAQPPETPVNPPEPKTSTGDLGSIFSAAASVDDLKIPKETHTRLAKVIDKHLRELRKPKTILTDKAATSKILDLEALKRFNDLRLEYSLKIQVARKRVTDA